MNRLVALAFAIAAITGSAWGQTQGSNGSEHSAMDHEAHRKAMQDAQRQKDVAVRGADVMPFNLSATTHHFESNAEGGVQQVIAKQTDDMTQVALVRRHLQDIREQFLNGNFGGPAHIHGQDMPGLSELRSARRSQIQINYKDISGGAQLTYRTTDASLVLALHQWFKAQLSDHGADAKNGHASHH